MQKFAPTQDAQLKLSFCIGSSGSSFGHYQRHVHCLIGQKSRQILSSKNPVLTGFCYRERMLNQLFS